MPGMKLDSAFEMAVSSIRFGKGVTREVGMDLAEIGAKSVLVVTDPIVRALPRSERKRGRGSFFQQENSRVHISSAIPTNFGPIREPSAGGSPIARIT
jgi:hypothetical protein